MSTKKKGFTLIEVMVVIAIVAILIAILYPVIERYRQAQYLRSQPKPVITEYHVLRN